MPLENVDSPSHEIAKAHTAFALADLERNTWTSEVDGNRIRVIGDDFGGPEATIEQFVIECSHHHSAPYRSSFSNGFTEWEACSPLTRYFSLMNWLLETYSEERRYSSRVTLFYRCCFAVGYDIGFFNRPGAPSSQLGKCRADLFNELTAMLKREAQKRSFINEQERSGQSRKKTLQDLLDYEEALFAAHFHMTVIEMELGYQDQYKQSVTTNEATGHFELFLKRRHGSPWEGLKGHIYKLGAGKQKGVYFRLLAFFDTSRTGMDHAIGTDMGMYWSVITGQKGWADNFNLRKHANGVELLMGIGLINHSDVGPREHLQATIRNMCGMGQYGSEELAAVRSSMPIKRPAIGGRPRSIFFRPTKWPKSKRQRY
ncbi:hypothetical protein DT070_21125 [Polaromonas sp. SP1]|uniref:hypothetical protein n=1 Tax=Polaromonas sp. SP1 TaxID=2268087 RepID=UPI000F09177D|nr:hypothetical protein [Polaromonas sp. SP1]AYQ30286.1 hypothetical protein DT070_21125 [Polaromonas sp. SP1]